LDINDLKQKVNDIDALIVTHTFGIPADFEKIKKVASHIPIIEDCAHSFLSTYKGTLTGKLGDAAIFSYGNAKFPSIGKGGFVLINTHKILYSFKENFEKLPLNSLWAEISNMFGNYIKTVAHRRPFYGLFSYPIKEKLDRQIDFAKKMSFNEAQALNGSSVLFFKKFNSFIKYYEKQRSNAKYIMNNLNEYYSFIDDSGIRELNFFLIPLRSNKRNLIINTCYKHGIEIGTHFANSIHWARNFGYKKGDCPNAEKNAREMFTLPCHYNLGKEYLSRIVRCLKILARNT
jgi:dTDP-4-amino-4,6-dideoxygalactose transaminase